jgi:DNA-directed RNA polymerase sigma subunit (sigma70/sigma32)
LRTTCGACSHARPIESRISRWRFGLDGKDEFTLKEIATSTTCRASDFRQLQEHALGTIRKG